MRVVARNQVARTFSGMVREKKLADPVAAERRDKLDAALMSCGRWDFDIWKVADLCDGDAALAAQQVVEAVLFTARRAQPAATLRPFISKVLGTYQDVPYHNALHGADVLQGMHALLTASPGFDSSLDDDTILVTLLAAISHDVGHPGFTNAYLVATSHELAIRYNDVSPLENMHARVSLDLARPYMDTLSPEDRRAGRALWIGLLLATDMKHHVSAIFDLERSISKARDGRRYDAADAKNHVDTLKIFIHACDVSNPTKKWETYMRWTDLVMEEFWKQAELESEAGLPPTMPLKSQTNMAKFQLGFIGFIRPLFATADEIASVDMSAPLRGLDDNKARWADEQEKGA